MRHGRSWSGYCLRAPLAPSKNPSDIALLEADLSALFHQFDGTGRKLKIESFERNTADFPGGPCRQIIHYSVYVEGLPECSVVFEGDEPKRRTRRPVIEAAICCDPVTGTLDVVSKGGRPLREDIAKSFAEHLLDSETTLTPVSRRDFDLDRLKRPMPFPTDPSDGIKSVEVTLLRLRNTARGFGRVTIEADDTEQHDDDCVGRAGVLFFGAPRAIDERHLELHLSDGEDRARVNAPAGEGGASEVDSAARRGDLSVHRAFVHQDDEVLRIRNVGPQADLALRAAPHEHALRVDREIVRLPVGKAYA